MRNSLAVLLLIFSASPLMAQNGGTGRENWFPNRGNVGVGTRTPSKDLEVIGDIKVSGITFTQMLEAISVKSGTISVSGNGLISGNLGLGVANPTERLDVLGNIKLSGNLSAQELVIQTLNANSGQLNSLSVNQDAFFGGKVGIGITATEKLHVSGNLKVSDMTFTSGLTASSISTGELSSAGKIVGSTMEVGSAEVTETLRAAEIFATERLEVAGPISVQDITVSGSLASNSISVGSNLSVTGATNLAGGATIGGMLNLQNVAVSNTFTGNSLVAADIQATNSLAVGQNLTVHSNGQIDGNFSVGGQLNANALGLSNINATGNVSVGTGLSVAGNSVLNGGVTIKGGLVLEGTANANILTASSIQVNGSLTASSGNLGGDLTVGGNVKAGIIEATEFRTTGGNSPFNFENAIISETLSVGSNRSVPSQYKLAVGGNIIATGVDIKIVESWPDYVFTPEHKLLSIDEVAAFVKAHGHLPGIASASEMEKAISYSVGQMDIKLLEKIEELTLYIIQLKKEIELLKAAGAPK